jgi:ABC-type branched-subunit amino acid transport system ATPase component
LEIADRGYVFSNGQIDLVGSSEELRASDEVANTYLGIAKE